MLNFIAQAGAVTLHGPDDLSVLLIGLTGLIWFSVALLVVAAAREGLRPKRKPLADEGPSLVDYRRAA
jgi:hypothetical protein